MTYYQHVDNFELLVSCVLLLIVIDITYTMTGRHLVERSRSISEETKNPQPGNTKRYCKNCGGTYCYFSDQL